MTETPRKDFIKDYTKFLDEISDASPDWTECVALGLLSTSLGRKRVLTTKKGLLHLNLFFLNIAPSGLFDKTVTLNPTIRILYRMGNKKTGYSLLPSKYSMEGMLEYMKKYNAEGCIIRDEFTSLLKGVFNKAYLAEGTEFLSEMYDGQLQIRYTKSSKLEKVTNVFVCLLSATTDYIFTIPNFKDIYQQGTGNRIIHTYSTLDEVKLNDMTGREFLLDPHTDRFRKEEAAFKKRLMRFRAKAPLRIGFNERAADLLAKYRNDCRREAVDVAKKDKRGFRNRYIVRCPEFALKMSALYSISGNEEQLDSLHRGNIVVLGKYAKKGIEKAEIHKEHYNKMADGWDTTPVSRVSYDSDRDFTKVLNLIKQRGGKMLEAQLIKELRWGKTKWNNIVPMLLLSEEISRDGKGKRGSPFLWKLTEE